MTQLAISNDWLPVDRWIAEALDNSVSASQIENDLVDCLLFWGAKHSIKGISSRDSLEKSLEAVRILVSLGLEDDLKGLRSDSGPPTRLRDFFKVPFTRLKTLESSSQIEAILDLESRSGDLSAYWKSESKKRIDNRLYAMVCKNFERAVAHSIQGKELSSLIKRLRRMTKIPCQMVEDRADETEEIHLLIRTMLAMHLNQIKRPTKRRRSTEDLEDSPFKGFEPLTKVELEKIQRNASLAGSRKEKIDRDFAELISLLDVGESAIQEICSGNTGSWTDYISRLWDLAEKNAANEPKEDGKKTIRSPLEWFSDNFIIDKGFEEREIGKTHEDEDMIRALMSIFTEPGVEYSRKDLDLARGAMLKKELDSILRKAEKKGFVLSRNEAGRKLYRFSAAESP